MQSTFSKALVVFINPLNVGFTLPAVVNTVHNLSGFNILLIVVNCPVQNSNASNEEDVLIVRDTRFDINVYDKLYFLHTGGESSDRWHLYHDIQT